jgi:flagellin
MALRINTNIAAMNAHKNMIKTDNSLSESLGRLSSGLRINKAADDASGMGIADSLRSQALGLGQAIRNGNDGISIVQTADAALEESINIVNTIKQKSIQAAQDGQTTDSRKAIQADITKLRDELDIIAKTTSFNNQKLLSGNFTDKKFQIGAYSGETIDISIQSSEASKIGHVSTTEMSFASEGTAELSIYSNQLNATFALNSVEIAYDNTSENSIGTVADAINVLSDRLGITADASVKSTTESNITAGTTDAEFAINGVKIGAIAVAENDSTGSLVAEINQKTDQHGVLASINQGVLTLTSTDDRAIEVTQGTDTTAVLGGTAEMSTFGTISLTQQGTAGISINNRLGGTAVATTNTLETEGITITTADSTVGSGSTIIAASTIGAGSVLAVAANVAVDADVFTTGSSTIGDGSVLAAGTIFNSGTTIEGNLTQDGTLTSGVIGTLGAGSVVALGSEIGAGTTTAFVDTEVIDGATANTSQLSIMTTGTELESGTVFAIGSTILVSDLDSGLFDVVGGWDVSADGLTATATAARTVSGDSVDATNGSITLAVGSTLGDNSVVGIGSTLGGKTNIETEYTTTADMTLTAGSTLITASVLHAGTNLTGAVLTADGTFTATDDMTAAAGSTITATSTLADGSSLSNSFVNTGDINVVGSMTLGAGSSLEDATLLADGSSIGGTVTLAANEEVDAATDMLLAAGSELATGSTITAGTFLTNDVVANDGETYLAGSALTADIVTSGALTMTNAMTLNGGSIMMAGTTLEVNDMAELGSADSSTSAAESYRLSDLDVTTQENAQIAISIADAALKNLDKVRSDLGSVQNQLTSTIANISTTRVNVSAAESTIRDVDFAEESSNFTKMQILAQAGTFAMSQANASSQNVLSLLQ